MVALRQEGKYWVVDFNWNGVHRQRSFKSKEMADKVHGLLEGWKEIQRAKEFIRFAIDQGMMNKEQRDLMETYLTFKLSDLTETHKFQIKEMVKEYKKPKKIIFCIDCKLPSDNYAKGVCKKCYMARFERSNARKDTC